MYHWQDRTPESVNLQRQATAYKRLVESDAVKTGSLKKSAEKENPSNKVVILLFSQFQLKALG